jgi:hypothetical protein
MKLSAFKNQLDKISQLNFVQPNGTYVPRHFHITEVGLVTKHFIDCGGTVRTEKAVNLQIWVAQDFDHRLEPLKLKKILALAENLFEQEDLEVEVEFQTDTIGRYGVEFDKENFLLTSKQTDCLAKELCGLPLEKTKLVLSELQSSASSCCTPGGGCC